MKKIYLSLFTCLSLVFFTMNPGKSAGQCTVNSLVNPSFESPVQPEIGNNILAGQFAFNGWSTSSAEFNIVRVDGTPYIGGPDTAASGNQYVDLLGPDYLFQKFALTCTSDIDFSGSFSSREATDDYVNWTGIIEILNSDDEVVASSTTHSFTDADGDTKVWYKVTGTATLPPGTYTFRVFLGDNGNFDDAFLCVTEGCFLPVKLSAFDAQANNCKVNLNWTAESETNFKKYEVEYSNDGIKFATIATIAGTAKSNNLNHKYNYQHNNPQQGKIFYRLKMIDIDGKYEFSKIITLNLNCNRSSVTVYPNPVTDILNINITNSQDQVTTARLFDKNGKLLYSGTMKSGINSINMSNLTKGVYLLTLINNLESKSIKIIK